VCAVMAGNGIPTRIFESLRPTPEVSFAVREYGCIAGVNVTASHNPKEYNGYKVYWQDGAQLPPQHADAVAKKMGEIDIFEGIKRMDYQEAINKGLVTIMGKETDEKFLAKALEQATDKAVVAKVADKFKMVYTPFHGTGHELIPEALKRLGMKHVICEPNQMVIDGNFPTVASPNPENPEGFALAVELARKEGADFILGSDPDADRVGLMVRGKDDNFIVLTGNQTGVLMLDYVIGAKKRAGTLPKNATALKTIVTTEMARKVAQVNGVQCFDTFTGFKFLAQKKDQLEASGEGEVIFSFEESYGYMMGDFVRDKDAVTAAVVATEMAAYYYDRGMTLYDALQELYEKYGDYQEKTLNLVMPGLDGLKKMADLMAGLRAQPPVEIAGVAVKEQKDYKDGSVVNVATGEKTFMELTDSNVLRYEMTDGTSVIVRPSGTEPKVKVYILANGESKAACAEKVAKYTLWAEGLKG
ncbi:MAG: phospho-sugar mutase, partial [Oscillospiraceae bacterium]|nr:phospho-sugar mutase [Oscillospiraceae bacterium]